jgi:16S rRNA G1207 methylase RsmC
VPDEPDEPDEPSAATERAGPDHYFTAEPVQRAAPRSIRLMVDGQAYELASATGVFSSDRVDAGTAVLLEHAPRPPARGTLLDLGAGYGPIACALAIRSPDAAVTAVDVNLRAVDLVQRNASALGLSNLRAMTPVDVPASDRFDAIYSNPPIRIGKPAMHAMLDTWLRRLTPSGRAYLVVHRNLGSDSLARWLSAQGWPVERLTSVRGYRLLAVDAR